MTKDLETEQVDAWLKARGFWAAYTLCIVGGHFALLSLPFLSTPTVWTVTNALHALVRAARARLLCHTPADHIRSVSLAERRGIRAADIGRGRGRCGS